MVIWLPSSIFMLVITRAVMATSSCSLFTPEMYLNRFTNIWACSSYPSCCCSKVRKPSERRLPRPPPPRRPPLCTPQTETRPRILVVSEVIQVISSEASPLVYFQETHWSFFQKTIFSPSLGKALQAWIFYSEDAILQSKKSC